MTSRVIRTTHGNQKGRLRSKGEMICGSTLFLMTGMFENENFNLYTTLSINFNFNQFSFYLTTATS